MAQSLLCFVRWPCVRGVAAAWGRGVSTPMVLASPYNLSLRWVHLEIKEPRWIITIFTPLQVILDMCKFIGSHWVMKRPSSLWLNELRYISKWSRGESDFSAMKTSSRYQDWVKVILWQRRLPPSNTYLCVLNDSACHISLSSAPVWITEYLSIITSAIIVILHRCSLGPICSLHLLP